MPRAARMRLKAVFCSAGTRRALRRSQSSAPFFFPQGVEDRQTANSGHCGVCAHEEYRVMELWGFVWSGMGSPRRSSRSSQLGLRTTRELLRLFIAGMLETSPRLLAAPPSSPPKPHGGLSSKFSRNRRQSGLQFFVWPLASASAAGAFWWDLSPSLHVTNSEPDLLMPSPTSWTCISPTSPLWMRKKGFWPHRITWRPAMLDACALKYGWAWTSPRSTACFTRRSIPDLSTTSCGLDVKMKNRLSGSWSSCRSPCRLNSALNGWSQPDCRSTRKVRVSSWNPPYILSLICRLRLTALCPP
mmetsp:Transcript_40327/g.114072  ORF Transcript_40327/g.114072 Transcript_40327/m.114072 type:complete len:301 (-) Transcript_40327:26-928(-)